MALLNEMYTNLIKSFPHIITAIIVFVVGMIIVHILNKIVAKTLARSRIDRTLTSFFQPIIRITFYVVVAIIALSTAGVPTATLLTAFGAVGLAVSLAVKDSLSNMAGGILLLASKPFIVGDAVEVNGVTGVVQKISILYTQLNTFDNREVFIPNGQISAEQIINMSAEKTRRLDLLFDISYADDPEIAKKIIADVVEAQEYALKDPTPIIRVSELSDSSVKIACYVWTEGKNYLTLKFNLLETVKKEFDKNGITIPFPQLDVHLAADGSSTKPKAL